MHVVDTSVVVKWVVREQDSRAALAWVGRPLCAPELLEIEFGNALWKKAVRQEIGRRQAALALNEVRRLVALLPTANLVHRAFAIGFELGHPIYDCIYLALAEHLDVPLVTADDRLMKRCAGTTFEARLSGLEEERP